MGTSYNYLDEKLETYQSQILQDISLSSTDKTIIDGTIEIAQNSAYLWMPKELGGLGLSLGLGQYHADERTNEDGCWDNIVAGDAAASASFWTTLGVSSILGAVPGTNTVILGGWAITAGLGSTFAGLMCEDCP